MLYFAAMNDHAITVPIERAVSLAGSQAKLAKLLGVTPQAVSQWMPDAKDPRPIPPNRAGQIEKLFAGKVTARELLPDFPWPSIAA